MSTVLILFYGYLTAFLFMPYVQQQLQAAFAHSGFVDPQAFVIKNTFDSGAEHALIAPLVGAIFGLAGGWAAWLLGSLRRKIALFLAIGELILASLALLSIQFASSLARSERPPYILFGLLALGMTLACAHPIFSALQKRPQIANGEW